MPHSSGGGSHGGGYHSSGGSHFSGRSSSGGSSGSSGSRGFSGGGFSARVSGHPFPGSVRYVYYTRAGGCKSFYANGKPDAPDKWEMIILCAFFTAIALPLVLLLLKAGLYVPRPLNTASYQPTVVYEDRVGGGTSDAVTEAMKAVLDSTGVAPGTEIVPESEWSGKYRNLETFALSEYLRLYDDEKHWLVVLSLPDAAPETDFTDWKWEGMIGDECSPAVNSVTEEKFTVLIQKHLLRAENGDYETALTNAYKEFADTAMTRQVGKGFLIAAAVIFAVYALLMVIPIRSYCRGRLAAKAVPVSAKAKEYNCEYCGAMYVGGTVTVCPKCGAPIPAHNEEGGK